MDTPVPAPAASPTPPEVPVAAPPPVSPEISPPVATLTPPETISLVEPPPLATPPPRPPAPTEPAGVPFIFHGETREFFRIWIVNTLLTLLTLGVFSAWAKVRKRRYFRGNTELFGDRFDYTAQAPRLLIGNAIVVLLFLAYALFGAVYPVVRGGAVLLFIALLPWIVVRSFSFNAHNTMYRGLRFRFHPSVSASAMLYLLKPIVIVLTLGLYYPAWARDRQIFSLSRHRLGTAYFRLELPAGSFYGTYFLGGCLVIAAAIVAGIVSFLIAKLNDGHSLTQLQLLPAILVYGAAAYIAKHFIFAEIFKRVWNEVRLDEHHFRTRMDSGEWVGMQIFHLLAMIATCGLAYPWAAIRSARYLADHLEFVPAGPIETIARVGSTAGSAVGDTAAEFAGVDFGL